MPRRRPGRAASRAPAVFRPGYDLKYRGPFDSSLVKFLAHVHDLEGPVKVTRAKGVSEADLPDPRLRLFVPRRGHEPVHRAGGKAAPLFATVEGYEGYGRQRRRKSVRVYRDRRDTVASNEFRHTRAGLVATRDYLAAQDPSLGALRVKYFQSVAEGRPVFFTEKPLKERRTPLVAQIEKKDGTPVMYFYLVDVPGSHR